MKNVTVLTYAWSKDTHDNEVMDWVAPYGKGRVYVTMLGHLWSNGSDTAMRCVGFQTMFIRGCQWAATGKVTHPVPKDFPTASEIRLSAMTGEPTFDITQKKPADRVAVKMAKDTAIVDVISQSGIGGATVTLSKGNWPKTVIVHLHLGGLESFAISNGKIKLTGSVLSHSGQTKRLYLTDDKNEGEREPGTEIRVFDANGKPVSGLPDKGGYFEIRLPKVLLDGQPRSLELGWIDFYRG